ncbi:two-component system, chemotaxis family, sensor kinase CheA [Fervidobacterium changbaicum]|uniref:histidine kinase n=2 Tax=Fervidobacterium TaxID=2422 RepID=A0AAI8GDC6_FERIS|nr:MULTISPECIES: response regulator [Fervidobacterium]AMW32962.1 response regulator [Fervidobacterium islandicum]QAV33003.1 chemotaxis protein CheA [Fervidobacterium changbaicum]SDH00837.1 two-component system, chemotaxis family, sensor kinase CheA [Fervidobacterium changbaicum]
MDFLEIFLQELNEKGQEAINLIKAYIENKNPQVITEIYRLFHTIKGSASLVGFNGFKELFHRIEEYFKRQMSGEDVLTNEFMVRLLSIVPEVLKKTSDLTDEELQNYIDVLEGKKSAAQSTTFVTTAETLPVEILQELLSNTLSAENSLMREDPKNALREIRVVKQRIISLLQNAFYVKLKQVLSNFEVLVMQEAVANQKNVRLELQIGEERIEKKDTEMLLNMLVHLVRNAVAHGIETPEERLKKGKPEVGKITIRSYVQGSELFLEIEDDGKGLDFEKIREKARQKGLGNLRPEDVIFVPGFSTKEEADGTSGRGIGLDAVKNFAMARGGDVEVVTALGRGTKFIVHFPIKTFLVRVLVVEADELQFCLDVQDILELVSKPEITNNQVKYKDKLYDISFSCSNPRFAIITTSGKAILVNNLVGIFDGQVSNESYEIIKGFVKNIFVYPLPIISPEKFERAQALKESARKVLVIDDSVVTRTILGKFLTNFGYLVIEAQDGLEGIEKFKKENPDVVICDVEMPGIDGFETTRKIRELNKDVPVIIFSTLTNEQLAKGLEVGANAYLSKDEPPERLVRLIEKFLQ